VIAISRRRQVDFILGKLQIVATVTVALFGAVLKATPADWGPLAGVIAWMQASAWVVVVVGPFTVGALQAVRRKFGNPWAWSAVQKLLDEFRQEVFGDLSEDPLDHHRATLFRHVGFSPTFAGPSRWFDQLVAVARSDHLTKVKIHRFHAPDDGESCEGIVGRGWRCRRWVLMPKVGQSLPEIGPFSKPREIDAYASQTGVKSAWVRDQLSNGKPLASCYAAMTVCLGGQPWGVIVLDSRRAGTIDQAKLAKFDTVFSKLLTPILERV